MDANTTVYVRDSTQIVHRDPNCVPAKGLLFEVPERDWEFQDALVAGEQRWCKRCGHRPNK
jgi:hypothetical protein